MSIVPEGLVAGTSTVNVPVVFAVTFPPKMTLFVPPPSRIAPPLLSCVLLVLLVVTVESRSVRM